MTTEGGDSDSNLIYPFFESPLHFDSRSVSILPLEITSALLRS